MRRSTSGARNLGAQSASGELLWFIDADVLPMPQALSALVKTQRHQNYACVSAGVMPEYDSYWRLAANLMAFPNCLSISAPGVRSGTPSFCLLMTKAAWQQFGPYDESFGNACEDMDLSYRMMRGGGTIGCEPQAAVYHRPARAHMADAFRRHQFYGTRLLLLVQTHASILPASQATRIIQHARHVAAPALLLLALLYVLRLMLQQPELRQFWYAIPAMAWLQYGFYLGAFVSAPEQRSK
jgi:GT2 family glycosyltransferase